MVEQVYFVNRVSPLRQMTVLELGLKKKQLLGKWMFNLNCKSLRRLGREKHLFSYIHPYNKSLFPGKKVKQRICFIDACIIISSSLCIATD